MTNSLFWMVGLQRRRLQSKPWALRNSSVLGKDALRHRGVWCKGLLGVLELREIKRICGGEEGVGRRCREIVEGERSGRRKMCMMWRSERGRCRYGIRTRRREEELFHHPFILFHSVRDVIMVMRARWYWRLVLHVSVMGRGVAPPSTTHGRPHGCRHVDVHTETMRRCPGKWAIAALRRTGCRRTRSPCWKERCC